VAVCCSVLQCVAVCGSVMQCVAVCCSVWQCVPVCCSVYVRGWKTCPTATGVFFAKDYCGCNKVCGSVATHVPICSQMCTYMCGSVAKNPCSKRNCVGKRSCSTKVLLEKIIAAVMRCMVYICKCVRKCICVCAPLFLFCKRTLLLLQKNPVAAKETYQSLLQGSFEKETYNFKEPCVYVYVHFFCKESL